MLLRSMAVLTYLATTGISLGANLGTDGNAGTVTIDGDITLTDNVSY